MRTQVSPQLAAGQTLRATTRVWQETRGAAQPALPGPGAAGPGSACPCQLAAGQPQGATPLWHQATQAPEQPAPRCTSIVARHLSAVHDGSHAVHRATFATLGGGDSTSWWRQDMQQGMLHDAACALGPSPDLRVLMHRGHVDHAVQPGRALPGDCGAGHHGVRVAAAVWARGACAGSCPGSCRPATHRCAWMLATADLQGCPWAQICCFVGAQRHAAARVPHAAGPAC